MNHPSALLDRIEDLPSLPAVVDSIERVIHDPRSSANEVTKEISKDPAITALLLKIVNSAYYGLSRSVTTLSHAIVLLGFAQVRNIVIATSVKKLLAHKKPIEGFEIEDLWLHSLATATISREIARRLEYSQKEEMFIAGLLHDIGKIALYSLEPGTFANVVAYANKNQTHICKAEEAVGCIGHAKLGQLIAQKWKLPRLLTDVIRFHHEPELSPENKTEVSIVHVANILARVKAVGSGGDPKLQPIAEAAWDALRFSVEDLRGLMVDLDALISSEVLINEAGLWK